MNRKLVLLFSLVVAGCASAPTGLPLQQVGSIPLAVAPTRFDYQSLDVDRGLLFIAHMGSGEVIEVDLHARKIVRTIPDLPDVHGVLVVPSHHRVYATATGRNEVIAFDEDSGARLFSAPTDTYPDGLAYDPKRDAVWSTNESAGTETVIDAATGQARATVRTGGEVGNVVYDPTTDRMIVAVQGAGDLAIVNPETFEIVDRIDTPGCDHPHGQALAVVEQLMFVGCESNAKLATVDLRARSVAGLNDVGPTPDVIVYDAAEHRIYVAAESGWVSVFAQKDGRTEVLGSALLADGAHTVALNPKNHHIFFPLPTAAGPELREFAPT
ncbi:YncE family protein [Smaragdicoccus niigatensis]|uniref:YncE family protein n=1 Tax=Smaragdicoccus niigatensis TaxID=359359 RepID=UPI0003A6DC57|nr:YncE family protein [Smaragdicoccus niigatensis]